MILGFIYCLHSKVHSPFCSYLKTNIQTNKQNDMINALNAGCNFTVGKKLKYFLSFLNVKRATEPKFMLNLNMAIKISF